MGTFLGVIDTVHKFGCDGSRQILGSKMTIGDLCLDKWLELSVQILCPKFCECHLSPALRSPAASGIQFVRCPKKCEVLSFQSVPAVHGVGIVTPAVGNTGTVGSGK